MRQVGLLVASVLMLTGCNALLGIDNLSVVDAGTSDVVTDATQPVCYGRFVEACVAPPTLPLELPALIDTDADPACTPITQPTGVEICAIAATGITMNTTTVVRGGRPLMLISTSDILVSQKLDASSTIANAQVGPAANSSLCAAPVDGLPAVTALGGGSGAAGGSFIGPGGGGGSGNQGGAAVLATASQVATSLRGGCAGGKGGTGTGAVAGPGGDGGAGGGAIYLVAAAGTITISDELRASGAGGRAGSPNGGGGGGGGSGGMIVLEAMLISVSGGEIVAAGGGGGEAARAAAGSDGEDDRVWDNRPDGGSGLNDAGDGGDGAYLAIPATGGSNGGGGGGGGAGGGGGGGGAGLVLVQGLLTGTRVSPPSVPL